MIPDDLLGSIEATLAQLPGDAGDQLADCARLARASTRHGDEPRWLDALKALPTAGICHTDLNQPVVTATPKIALNAQDQAVLLRCLQSFIPWRKGPFSICGCCIDTEWRSDWKWERLHPHLQAPAGRRILDIGCGNGYHLFRLAGAGAKLVVGIDPSLLFLYQFNVLNYYLNVKAIAFLPLRSDQLPAELCSFDTVLSMGVLYHRRQPASHLRELLATLRHGGELALETLVVRGESTIALESGARYARMRNVWRIPTTTELVNWVTTAGFENVRVVSEESTTSAEQRTTPWMPYESLSHALDPLDSSRTIEGLPAPRRAILIANRPEK